MRAGNVWIVLVLLPLAGWAQPKAKPENLFAVKWGVFGGLHTGVSLGDLSTITTDLEPLTALSTDSLDFTLRPWASQVGGQIQGLAFGKVIVSLGGTRTWYQNSESFRGSAQVTNWQVGGSVGYAVYNKKQLLVFPFVGFSTGMAELEVTNTAPEDLEFGGAEIPRNRTVTYDATNSQAEVGVSARYLLRRDGGLMFGLDLGYYTSASADPWQATAEGQPEPQEVNAAEVSGGYLRVTLGGGIFTSSRTKTSTGPKKRVKIRDEERRLDEIQPGQGLDRVPGQ